MFSSFKARSFNEFDLTQTEHHSNQSPFFNNLSLAQISQSGDCGLQFTSHRRFFEMSDLVAFRYNESLSDLTQHNHPLLKLSEAKSQRKIRAPGQICSICPGALKLSLSSQNNRRIYCARLVLAM
jgi:hypothetical protein